MKSFRKLISIVLVLMLIMSMATVALQASALSSGQDAGFGTISSVAAEREVGTGTGIIYNEFKVAGTTGGTQQMYSLTFNPQTSDYIPMVFCQTVGYGALTLDSANQAEALGYDVKGGVDASFGHFVGTSANTYGGIMISDGRVMHGTSSPDTTATWVMTADNSGKISFVESLVRFAVSAKNGEWTAPIECINACPDSSTATKPGIYYYDSFSGTTTFTKTLGVEIVFEKLDSTELIVGGTLKGKVVEIRNSTAVNGALASNQFVLYASNSSEYAASLRTLAIGDTVEVTANEDMPDARETMESCVTACPTYGYDLVRNGENIVSSIPLGEAFATQRAQRTGVGIKTDGTLVIVTTQGRGTYAGLTLYEFADYFISQGCVTAVNFDGGGSTQMTVENESGTLYAPITFGRRVTSSFLIVKRPTVSGETKAELAGLINEAEAVTRKTTYLNEAIISAKAVYDSELSLPGEYTRAIMELKAGISEEGTTNLALGKEYTITGSISSDYITDLTDGVLSDVSGLTGKWNGWTSNGTVTIDLGKSYSIDKIKVHMLSRPDYAIISPTITAAFSDDGVNFKTSSAQFPITTSTSSSAYWSQADNLAVTARYVRLNIALNGGFGFVNEIEVLGNDYDANIALGKDYLVEGEIGEQYNYTTPLNDGVALETISITKNRWLGLHSDGSVTFDLGNSYKVNKIRVHMLNIASYGIYPANLSISVSNDGKTFTEYKGTFKTQTEDGFYWCELDNIVAVGRYVKISFARTGSWVFLNEIELYGERNFAFDADYEIVTDGGHDGLNSKYHENGERLTDGSKLVGDVNNDNYVDGVLKMNTGYTRWVNATYVDIIVDLGAVMPTGFYTVYSVAGYYGYTTLEGLKISVSTDGINYTDVYGQISSQEIVGYAESYDGTNPELYKHTVTATSLVNARYVKFTITPCSGYGYVGIDEVEVLGDVSNEKYEPTYKNLLSGLTHTSTTGSEKGALTYIADITDGIAKTDSNADGWFGLRSSSLDAKNANTINDCADLIFDLGGVYDVSGARIHLKNLTGNGICPPKSLKLWVSDDGVDYTKSSDFSISTENGICYWATITDVDKLVGRFVKITVEMNADKSNGGGGWVFLNEIEVYGEEYKAPEDTTLYKSVSYEIKDDKIILTVVTASGNYNRIKVTTADNLGGSLGVAKTYTVDENGNYVWTIKVAAPTATTNYAFDLCSSETGKYLKEYHTYEVEYVDTEIYKSASYEIVDDKIVFTVVTLAGDYNRIKVANANAVSTSLGVGNYTVDENGNYVWTVKANAPKETTTYAFDLRTTANKYLKDYYEFKVEIAETAEIFKSTSYEIVDGKVIFTAVTAAGDYNRVKISSLDNIASYVKYTNDHTVNADGDYVWTLKFDAPEVATEYALDVRYASTMKYAKDYYYVTINPEVTPEEPETDTIFVSGSGVIADDKLTLTIVTLPTSVNRVKVMLTSDQSSYVKLISKYQVNADGNYVWTATVAAPTETTSYTCDARSSETSRYLKDYFTFEVAVAEEEELYKSVSYEIVGSKIVFTVVTAAGDYNRIKVANANDVSTSLGVGSYTVDANGNYVWTVKITAPTESTSYAFDLRTTDNKYLKDYYTYDVEV